jgi:hypothetical protein
LAEKAHIAPNRHAQARVKAAMRAAVEDPIPPATHGDMMPACRIIFVNERRMKRNACLYAALGLHMKDRKEKSVLDRYLEKGNVGWIFKREALLQRMYVQRLPVSFCR